MPARSASGVGASISASTGASMAASMLAASVSVPSSSPVPAASLPHAPMAAVPIASPMPLSVSLREGLIVFPPGGADITTGQSDINPKGRTAIRLVTLRVQAADDRKDYEMRFAGFALALGLGLAACGGKG